MLTSALVAGLLAGGCTVTLAGMAPTPTIAFVAGKRKMAVSIIVTASHNPPEYNGFKFHNPDGAGFSVDQQETLQELLEASEPVAWQQFGSSTNTDPVPIHVDALVDACTVTRPHKVVLDAALGVGGLVTPLALRRLGANVTTLNVPPNGKDYARNCGATKIRSAAAAEWKHFVCLDDLSAITRATQVEVGLAHDGDADRLLAVDNKGRIIAGDTLLALVADYYLATRGGKVIATTISCSSVVDHVAKKHGARVVRSRVGDVFVSNLVKEHKAVLGGEPSGPFVFPEVHYCPDGPLAACKVLELLDWAKRPLSELVDALPSTHLLRTDVACPDDVKVQAIAQVASIIEAWPEVEEISRLDGVRASFEDSSWLLVRPSGTEPLVRITVEALTPARAKALLKDTQKVMRQVVQ
jgi:phosphoglucosamine mutase